MTNKCFLIIILINLVCKLAYCCNHVGVGKYQHAYRIFLYIINYVSECMKIVDLINTRKMHEVIMKIYLFTCLLNKFSKPFNFERL